MSTTIEHYEPDEHGLGAPFHLYVALDEAHPSGRPTMVGYLLVDLTRRGRDCATCINECGVGRIFWIDPAYREMGLFTLLYTTAYSELRVNTLYYSGGGVPGSAAHYVKYDIRPAGNALPNDKSWADVRATGKEWADKIRVFLGEIEAPT